MKWLLINLRYYNIIPIIKIHFLILENGFLIFEIIFRIKYEIWITEIHFLISEDGFLTSENELLKLENAVYVAVRTSAITFTL